MQRDSLQKSRTVQNVKLSCFGGKKQRAACGGARSVDLQNNTHSLRNNQDFSGEDLTIWTVSASACLVVLAYGINRYMTLPME